MTSEANGEHGRRGVFLSVTEGQKASLARPFRDLLLPLIAGYIVADLPLIDGTYSPEEKVNAYLDRSEAMVVFATLDDEAGKFPRANIADEIARARMKPHLRTRICVLKQSGVMLASNTNPVYRNLDPQHPEAAFVAALEQLKEWGFDVDVPDLAAEEPVGTPRPPAASWTDVAPTVSEEVADDGLARALAQVPQTRSSSAGASLVLVATSVPRTMLLRPSELEDADLATWLEREALYGERPVLERGEGTATSMSGTSLVSRQARAWVAIDEEGTVVVSRPIIRRTNRSNDIGGIIEEDVIADLGADLAFVDRVLDRIDHAQRGSHVVPIAAILGATYTGWRTRAEQAASPSSMSINIIGDRIVSHLSPPAQSRETLSQRGSMLATDLMVLLLRAALKR